MADFFQTGAIATLHRLGRQDVARLELELREFSREAGIALVLPCHVKELGTPALRQAICAKMKRDHGLDYVERVLPDYGYRQIFFRDPDGNVLELGEWPPSNEMFPQ